MDLIKKILSRLPKFLKTKRAILAIIVFVILAFILTRGSADKDKIKTAQAEQKNIASEIVASGKIASLNETTIHSAISGKVVWVAVKEGDWVKKGQVIASLDKEVYEIALRQKEQDMVAADAALQKVYDDIKDRRNSESYTDKINRTAAEATKNQAVDAWLGAQRNLKDTVLTD